MNEQAVIERAKQGDEHAWRWLHERHHPHVQSVVRRIVGNSHTVEDICQEVWYRVVAKIDLFEFRSSFKTWMTKVASNVAYNCVRTVDRAEAIDPDAVAQEPVGRVEDAALDWIVVQEALDRLPSGYRTVLVMRSQGFSHDEIAETLGIDPGTSRSQYHKGLAALRSLLGYASKS